MTEEKLLELVLEKGSPLFIVDHNILRENYRKFTENLPKVQCYYAVKANSNPEIIRTLFKEGASFDVASYQEFMEVYSFLSSMEEEERQNYIWDKVIFSNTIKERETLKKIRKYRPLMTYDNFDEIGKIKKYCDTAGLILRLKVPDVGSQIEMGSKFGAEPSDAAKLIKEAFNAGLNVEGLSFHVGSQCLCFDNYTAALEIAAEILNNARKEGYNLNIIDIGGGFPAPYDEGGPRFEQLSEILNAEFERLFPPDVEILAEPGRFIVANTAVLVSEIIGRSRREGKRFYHINDGIYHTYSGIVFDHWNPEFKSFRSGKMEICSVVGPTCDSFDKISLTAQLPGDLELEEFLYTPNIGAYSVASSTKFNGFDGAKVVHVNL